MKISKKDCTIVARLPVIINGRLYPQAIANRNFEMSLDYKEDHIKNERRAEQERLRDFQDSGIEIVLLSQNINNQKNLERKT